MTCNVGGLDRALRIIVGLALIANVFIGLQTVWMWIGIVPFFTGLFGICPMYYPLGLNTCPVKKTDDKK